MKKYEYMTVDLSAEPSFNVHVKMERYIEKLNEYGRQGWRLISGTDDWKFSVFERELMSQNKVCSFIYRDIEEVTKWKFCLPCK